MMKPLIALSFALLTSVSAMSAEDLYYWDNNSGLKKADHCELITMKNPRFGFSTNNFGVSSTIIKNSDGEPVSDLVNGSLVKKKDGPQAKGNDLYEVVGTNQDSVVLETLRSALMASFAVRGNTGYLAKKQVESIENRVIQIKEKQKNLAAGLFLKVHREGEYLRLSCPEFASSREYLVFHAYSKSSSEATSMIGVYWDETGLFRSVKTFEKTTLNASIPAIKNGEKNASNIIRDASTNKTVETEKKETPKSEDIKNVETRKNTSSKVQEGLDSIVCSSSSKVNIRNSELREVIFQAKTGEKVKFFQSFGDDSEIKKNTVIDGTSYSFIKVEFADREAADQRIGYIVESFISPKSECDYVEQAPTIIEVKDTKIKGINDPACCMFPTIKKVNTPFTDGMRNFGWNRPGNRIHAANDLYRVKDEAVVSVAPGVVLRATRPFYEGTYVTEVLHSGGFIVRYGETTSKQSPGIGKNKQVKMGQVLGHIGKIGNLTPMLHLEIYSGLKGNSVDSNPLSRPGNTFYLEKELNGKLYGRRSDLLHPTKYLLKWENEKFKK